MGVSSETQGQQIGQNEVNRAEIVAAKVFYKSISPWETSLSRRYLIHVKTPYSRPAALLAVNIYLLLFACG